VLLDLGLDEVLLLLLFLALTEQAEDEVEGRLLLDVVVSQGATILQLLAGEDQSLLVRRNAFLILNFSLTDQASVTLKVCTP